MVTTGINYRYRWQNLTQVIPWHLSCRSIMANCLRKIRDVILWVLAFLAGAACGAVTALAFDTLCYWIKSYM